MSDQRGLHNRRHQMLRDIFINRWILGCIGFFVIFAGLCYFYYHHTTAPYREQAAEHDEMIRQSKKQRTALTAKRTERAADAPMDSHTPTAEKPITETPVTEDTEMEAPAHTAKAEKGIKMPQEESQDTPVSPHGFGAFPDVPQGFPANIRIPWQWQEIPYDAPKELAVRVLIKLWEQGDTRFTGVEYTDDYKIYPHYPNTAYVRYGNTTDEDGTPIRYISGIRGGPDLPEITSEMLDSGVVPGVQLISEEQGGIDALQFLNLE